MAQTYVLNGVWMDCSDDVVAVACCSVPFLLVTEERRREVNQERKDVVSWELLKQLHTLPIKKNTHGTNIRSEWRLNGLLCWCCCSGLLLCSMLACHWRNSQWYQLGKERCRIFRVPETTTYVGRHCHLSPCGADGWVLNFWCNGLWFEPARTCPSLDFFPSLTVLWASSLARDFRHHWFMSLS